MVAHRDGAVLHADLDVAAGRAPLGRVVEQIGDRALDRRRHAVHGRFLQVRQEGHLRLVSACTLDRVRGEQVEAHLLRLGDVLLPAREVDQLGDQRRHLAELLDQVVQEPLALSRWERAIARQHLDVRAQAGQRRAQLVRRVGDELPL